MPKMPFLRRSSRFKMWHAIAQFCSARPKKDRNCIFLLNTLLNPALISMRGYFIMRPAMSWHFFNFHGSQIQAVYISFNLHLQNVECMAYLRLAGICRKLCRKIRRNISDKPIKVYVRAMWNLYRFFVPVEEKIVVTLLINQCNLQECTK